jgi:hypothetical protein
MLDTLATQLMTSALVKKATRKLETPMQARKHAPYVGMLVTTEEEVVEDTTHVRFEVDVSLILVNRGTDIEGMLDAVKNILYNTATATAIGALLISYTGAEEVSFVDDDTYTGTRILITLTYVATKGAF